MIAPHRRAASLLVALTLVAVARAEQVDSTYDHVEQVSGFYLLFTGDQRSFSMDEAVYQQHRALLLVLRRGDPIRIEVGDRNRVVSLARGERHGGGDPAGAGAQDSVNAALADLHRGDVVRIDGVECRFLELDGDRILVSPRIPGSQPPAFQGRSVLDASRVRKVEVVTRREVDPAEVSPSAFVNDALSQAGLERGDTVTIELSYGSTPPSVTGLVVGLDGRTVRVLPWRRGRFGEPQDVPRANARSVRPEVFESSRTLSIAGQSVALTLRTCGELRGDGSWVEAQLTHTAGDATLSGLALRASDAAGKPGEALPVPPLFPGLTRTIRADVANLQGGLALEDGQVVAVSTASPEGRTLLLGSLQREAADGPTLTALYEVALGGGEPDLQALVISRALVGDPACDPKGERARAALAAAGEPAIAAILAQIHRDHEALLTVLADGQLRPAVLPSGWGASDYDRALISLLSDLPEGLSGDRLQDVFALGAARRDLLPAVQAGLAGHPARSAGFLLGLAVGGQGIDPQQTQLAQGFLREGAASYQQDLIDAAEERGADRAALEQAIQRGVPAPDVVEQAIMAAVRQDLLPDLELARQRAKAGQVLEAWELIEAMQSRYPGFPEARALLEEIELPLARAFLTQRRRAEAYGLLEHAGAKDPAAARRLGALVLEAAQEELTGVDLRSHPHLAATILGVLGQGALLDGVAAGDDWVEVTLAARKGYVRRACLEPLGSRWRVATASLPLPVFEGLLAEVRRLDPALTGETEHLLGQRYLNDALIAYEALEYGASLPLFEKAAELLPGDPRLSYATWARLHDQGLFMAVLVGLPLFCVVLTALLARWSRRRIIKLTAEKKQAAAPQRASQRLSLSSSASQKALAQAASSGPLGVAKLVIASVLAIVILHQAWMLWRAF